MDDLRRFCYSIPKIELHAHLNGCIRLTTFRQLLSSPVDQARLDMLEKTFALGDTHSRMSNVFEKFTLLRSCVTSLEDIRRITRETLEDFVRDNVIYAELRTRPRSFDSGKTPSSAYIEAIVEIMKEYEERICCRLILSIDRTQSVEQAMETLKLAQDYRPHVVGLDLSGDPNVKSFERFRSVFDLAKQNDIATTIHIGELPDQECLHENDSILDYRPTRLGHFNYRTAAQEQRLLKERIPLELCPRSNQLTMNLSNLTEHHFNLFYTNQHPVAICTDDSGLMDCCLSSEIFDIAQTFHLTKKQIYEFLLQTSNLIFDRTMIEIIQTKLNSFFEQSGLF